VPLRSGDADPANSAPEKAGGSTRAFPDVYVINIDGSDARLSAITAELQAAGLPFTRLSAVDGRTKQASQFAQYDAEAAVRYGGRVLLAGEVACFLSHVAGAQRLLDSDATYALVLEDDAELAPDFAAHVTETLRWLESRPQIGWDVINLGSVGQKYVTRLHQSGEHVLLHSHYFPMMASGLLWTRAGAAHLVSNSARIWTTIDLYLRHTETRRQRGLVVYPPLVRQVFRGTSDIDYTIRARDRTPRGALYFLRKQRRTLLNNTIAILGLLRSRLTPA
jgi:glycosyl transferase, family 25